MQYEQFSEKAKLLIDFVKNSEYFQFNSSEPIGPDYGSWLVWNRKEQNNKMIIFNSCLLFNIPGEFNDIFEFCKSKNYWLKDK